MYIHKNYDYFSIFKGTWTESATECLVKYIDAEDLNLEVRQPMPYILIYVVVQCALFV